MKKITMNINGKIDDKKAMAIKTSLNDLSGVVAADVAALEARAYAYAGDKLNAETVLQKVQEAGAAASVAKEEYIGDVDEFKAQMWDM